MTENEEYVIIVCTQKIKFQRGYIVMRKREREVLINKIIELLANAAIGPKEEALIIEFILRLNSKNV